MSEFHQLDDAFLSRIGPDVLRVLGGAAVFEKLDDAMCPTDDPRQLECHGDYSITESILVECGFNPEDGSDTIQVLRHLGACCDCEVLYNVAPDNRLKAKYWRGAAAEADPPHEQESRPE